ncbi:YcxB family protein [Lacinutrix mariniflava]|uniref:YcxB family protein n=1 Tax=Lacinutrix mariniflava TaxID=342955 RepID=UPI000B2F6D6E|nr:YcxB family protein [Lacinutrix mariniflava]
MSDKEIIIKPKFDFKTVSKANLYMSFNRLITKILIVLAVLFFICFLLAYFFLEGEIKNDIIYTISPILYLYLLYPVLLILLTRYSTKKSLKNNYRLKEDFRYIFNNEYFRELGETFDLKHKWGKLLKIKEKEDYFLIYQNKNRANIISKNSFNENQLSDFKKLLKTLDIKTNFN